MRYELCSLCHKAVGSLLIARSIEVGAIESFEDPCVECSLCWGMCSNAFLDQLVEAAEAAFRSSGHDGSTFVLAFNVPVAQHLRCLIAEKAIGNYWDKQSMSPKERASFVLMERFRQRTNLRPSLASDLLLTVNLTNDEFDTKDINFFTARHPRLFIQPRSRKRHWHENSAPPTSQYTKGSVQKMVNALSIEQLRYFTVRVPTTPLQTSVAIHREDVYIAGRYNKYSRGLPQSPWAPSRSTAKIPGNSVSEKICDPARSMFQAEKYRFIASGREDINVRMLGTGRPFAVALVNAKKWGVIAEGGEKRIAALEELRRRMNAPGDIHVSELSVVNVNDLKKIKQGQDEKRKRYTCLCYSWIPLTSEHVTKFAESLPVKLDQETPVRVLKRRANKCRKRMIHSGNIRLINDNYFLLQIETQAGTYVKEFVTSDFGRTDPNVGQLMGLPPGYEVAILELDVDGVDLEWPPTHTTT